METLFINGLELDGEFLYQVAGVKIFLCQHRITATDTKNHILASHDLLNDYKPYSLAA